MVKNNSISKCDLTNILIILILIIASSLILQQISLLASNCKKNSIDDCMSSTFAIKCTDESRMDSVGTGFAVKNNNIITNAHVVSYLDNMQVCTYSDIFAVINNQEISLTIKCVDFEKDYAILSFRDDFKLNYQIKIGKTTNLKVGDFLACIGNANNYGICYNTGVLSSYGKYLVHNNALNVFYQTSIEISKGCSGGPVLNKDNKVVGIMTFKIRDNNSEYVDGVSYFIPIETLIEKL